MNELENRFESLINQVRKVVLKLLCSLNIDKVQEYFSEKIQIFSDFLLVFSGPFELKSHISADASDCSVMIFERIVHFAKG